MILRFAYNLLIFLFVVFALGLITLTDTYTNALPSRMHLVVFCLYHCETRLFAVYLYFIHTSAKQNAYNT